MLLNGCDDLLEALRSLLFWCQKISQQGERFAADLAQQGCIWWSSSILFAKGRFTRYDFVAYDKLTTGLRHELFRVNQTYNSLNGPKSCRRPVVSLSYATKSYRVNRP